jgi:hypothetical protein
LERKKPTPVEMAKIVAHPEVPNEETEVETVRALEDRYGKWHLAVQRQRQMKKQTQDDGGSRKKLAAACRQMTHFSIPTLCKGHGCQGPGRIIVMREAPKEQTVEKRHQAQPKCNNGIRDRGLKQQL